MPDAYEYVVSIIALSLVITPLWLYAIRRMHLLRRRRLYHQIHDRRHNRDEHGKSRKRRRDDI
jgi:hypothetical protein